MRAAQPVTRAASEPAGMPQPAAAGGAPTTPVEHETRRRGGFIRESSAELHKVDWPNRAQTIQGTVVVIIAVAIVGAYPLGGRPGPPSLRPRRPSRAVRLTCFSGM